MKRIILLFLMVVPLLTQAQQLKIYTDTTDYKYFALYAYGLPREVVKRNAEIKKSKFGDTGIMRRNHTTKYIDDGVGSEGYNANQKLSFAFLIAPYNVDATGREMKENESQAEINWYDASGWDPSIDSYEDPIKDPWGNPDTILVNTLDEFSIANETPTGCAAYRGPKGTDKVGSWRLPTQREALVMFTIMEHALTMQGAEEVTNNIINGKYWTSTELKTSAKWKVWYVDSNTGTVVHLDKVLDGGTVSTAYARCVRDIDNEAINE